MHTKQLGNLGELKVASDLVKQGYYVFTELGDICKADLIIIDKDYKPIKVQVKAANTKNGTISIKSHKSGPAYSFPYKHKHADIYAIYVIDKDIILYLSNTKVLSYQTLTIRIDPSKNKQIKNVNYKDEFTDFKKALRDCT